MSSIKNFFYSEKEVNRLLVCSKRIEFKFVNSFRISLIQYAIEDGYIVRYYVIKYLVKKSFLKNLIGTFFKSKLDWNTFLDEDGESLKFKTRSAAAAKAKLIVEFGKENGYYDFFVLLDKIPEEEDRIIKV